MRSISEKLGVDAPPTLPERQANSEILTDTFTLRLETPMMGGGVQKGEVDWERPIRASSIRGHLRSWWRLFCAPTLSGDDLRSEEGAIFGDTKLPSELVVEVTCAPYHEKRRHNEAPPFGFDNFSPEAYALFPARGTHDIAKEGLTFTLTLRYPQIFKDDIRLTLAAWITFGGIGARTRRGLGTLSCVNTNLSGGGALSTLKELLAANTAIRVYKRDANSAPDAWHDALEVYQQYRQGPDVRGRNHEKTLPNGRRVNVPGRSKWPEPDSLRYLSGCALDDGTPAGPDPTIDTHNHTHWVVPAALVPSFPRAALGLPIEFHFADGGRSLRDTHRDPPKTHLTACWNGRTIERMASPVITKAIYDNEAWYAAILVLPHSDALTIEPSINLPISEEDRNAIRGIGVQDTRYHAILPMQGADNAITGFENYVRANGFH